MKQPVANGPCKILFQTAICLQVLNTEQFYVQPLYNNKYLMLYS